VSGKRLVAAGEAAANVNELPFGVRELIDASEEILVILPTLPDGSSGSPQPPIGRVNWPTSGCRPCWVSWKGSGPARRARLAVAIL
jgi:hypothetical protein